MVYSLALWKQNSAAPKDPQAIPYLALFKHEKGPFNPLTLSMFSLGTRTSSIMIIPVIEAFKDPFPSILGAERPLNDFSQTKPLISPCSSLAQITKTSAMGEFVIQFLAPLRM